MFFEAARAGKKTRSKCFSLARPAKRKRIVKTEQNRDVVQKEQMLLVPGKSFSSLFGCNLARQSNHQALKRMRNSFSNSLFYCIYFAPQSGSTRPGTCSNKRFRLDPFRRGKDDFPKKSVLSDRYASGGLGIPLADPDSTLSVDYLSPILPVQGISPEPGETDPRDHLCSIYCAG